MPRVSFFSAAAFASAFASDRRRFAASFGSYCDWHTSYCERSLSVTAAASLQVHGSLSYADLLCGTKSDARALHSDGIYRQPSSNHCSLLTQKIAVLRPTTQASLLMQSQAASLAWDLPCAKPLTAGVPVQTLTLTAGASAPSAASRGGPARRSCRCLRAAAAALPAPTPLRPRHRPPAGAAHATPAEDIRP